MKNAELAAIEEQLLDALPVVKRVLKDHPEPKETLENLIAGTIGWLRHGQDELLATRLLKGDDPNA